MKHEHSWVWVKVVGLFFKSGYAPACQHCNTTLDTLQVRFKPRHSAAQAASFRVHYEEV